MLKRDAVSPSLNEIEALAAKAARGAGAGWGMAEDVARAVRWMAKQGLDWSVPLVRLLESGVVATALAPILDTGDRLAGARSGDRLALDGAVALWVLAILSGAVYGRDLCVDVAGAGWQVRLHPEGGISTDGIRLEALPPGAVEVCIPADAAALPCVVAGTAERRAIPVSVWQALESYAARTYVQPSLRSRLTGAGGGRVDDD